MREIAPFGLRMPPELKARVEAQAKAAGRSINTEILARLKASFEEQQFRSAMSPVLPAYVTNDISDAERQVLAAFKNLPLEKQAALLTLLK